MQPSRILLALSLAWAGCATTNLPQSPADVGGCPSSIVNGMGAQGNWTASCDGRTYYCTGLQGAIHCTPAAQPK